VAVIDRSVAGVGRGIAIVGRGVTRMIAVGVGRSHHRLAGVSAHVHLLEISAPLVNAMTRSVSTAVTIAGAVTVARTVSVAGAIARAITISRAITVRAMPSVTSLTSRSGTLAKKCKSLRPPSRRFLRR